MEIVLFVKKCENRMSDMLSNGTTLLFVSHSANDIKKLCQNVIWLNKGETKVIGKTSDILFFYMKIDLGYSFIACLHHSLRNQI